jgi:hypothetical protein
MYSVRKFVVRKFRSNSTVAEAILEVLHRSTLEIMVKKAFDQQFG